ncbi:MAG: threonine--tRNA ligase [Candidatus Pacebacteria bacterium]|nr:threonine--tRNA ligase [Candidatus Paceibacterota bacterium]MCF7862950.1 threonine--tRNA ligase [Candidatus Paceibacterota bacterium]
MEKEQKLHNLRHTLAHLLASAVLEIYPNTKNSIGPAIDNGFYYDFDFESPISDKDLETIEKKMLALLKDWNTFAHEEKSVNEAKDYFKNNPYKIELIEEIAEKGEKITFYTAGNFTDLCRGGHLENPNKEIRAGIFKLDRIAGAYWRGDEKNKMLTRIYGLAFESKEELDAYLIQKEEALKRDHRKIGKEMGLFTIIDEIGPGLPLFYPKGTILRKMVENFISEEQTKRGYKDIWIPHITKGELYKVSGHLDKYDAMYSPMKIDENDYYLKPMNCPHFMMLYKTLPHSYRDLPLRYTCTTTNYRYEKSGELSGLTRVRALTQDDCHIFCAESQIKKEIEVILDMIKDVYKAFGLNDFYVRISLRDSQDKSKYLGDDKVWNTAENALREIVKSTGWKYEEAENEAAFYGPKLDFMFKDAIGREWQLSTIQLDFNLPEKFELEYISNESKKERPVVIHRAILGSTERFLGVMIEHYAGNFPLWLSPVQVKILPISTDKHSVYAQKILQEMLDNNIRAEIDESSETLGKKIREAKMQKIPYLIVIGDKEMESETLTIETRNGEKLEGMDNNAFIQRLQEEIRNKTI